MSKEECRRTLSRLTRFLDDNPSIPFNKQREILDIVQDIQLHTIDLCYKQMKEAVQDIVDKPEK